MKYDPMLKSIQTEGSRYLTERQLADWLNLSVRTLQGWRLTGEGPSFEKFGRCVRYAIPTVQTWIADRERTSTSASMTPRLCNIHGSITPADPVQGDRS